MIRNPGSGSTGRGTDWADPAGRMGGPGVMAEFTTDTAVLPKRSSLDRTDPRESLKSALPPARENRGKVPTLEGVRPRRSDRKVNGIR